MKYLLPLLLISIFCNAQKLPDDVKVTAYRLIMPHDDGPCSIRMYAKYNEFSGGHVTAESSDKTFVKKLLDIKKNAYKKASLNYFCSDRGVGGDPVPNMLVISGTNIADTVYTDYTNQKIFFPDKQRAYFDKDKSLIKAFPELIKEFYDYDFNRHLSALFSRNRDSITDNLVFNHNKSLPEFVKEFNSNPEPFKLVSSDSVYALNDIKYVYAYHKDTIAIQESFVTFDLKNPESTWSVHGLKIGDSEDSLKKKFPQSTETFLIDAIRFEDIKRRYYYEVKITSHSGSVYFMIADGKIESIAIVYH